MFAFSLLRVLSACAETDPSPEKGTEDSLDGADADGDGVTEAQGDCDDADAAVSPSAAETCNAIDDDCDGDVDESGGTTWYVDDDGDAYGADASASDACTPPEGAASEGGDCADQDAEVHPGATEICDGADSDCDGTIDDGVTTTFWADADGDGAGDATAPVEGCTLPAGHADNADDCNDGTARAHPEAEEICDEIDNDCDTVVDEEVTQTFWADRDADGWGTDAEPHSACALPTGYAEEPGDCDDFDPEVSPEVAEICDGLDQDCDSVADEGLDGDGDGTADCFDTEVCDGFDNDGDGDVDEPDATDATTWYIDFDGDGHGSAGYVETACAQPVGYVAVADDCDDGDATAFPGSAEAADGDDDDCDGTVDEGTSAYDDDEDGFSEDEGDCDDSDFDVNPDADEICDDAVDNDCDGDDAVCDGDGDGYAPGDDCDDADASVHPGAAESADGVDNDCDGTVDEGTSAYDDDADGYSEDAGDCDDADAARNPGEIEVCDNGLDDDCDGSSGGCGPSAGSLSGADAKYTGEASGDFAGYGAAAAGDVNRDGYDDFLVGAYDNDDGATSGGSAYLVLGSATPASRSLSAADAQYTGEATDDIAAASVAGAGDVDGDGDDDMVIGAQYNDDGGTTGGSAYLLLGNPSPASRSLASADAQYTAEAANHQAGQSVAGAGDVDDDGYADLLVGGPFWESGGPAYGAAWLVLGGPARASHGLASADARYTGESGDDLAGLRVAGAGDVDGDGHDDMLIGAPGNDEAGTSAGAAYLLLGSAAPSSEGLVSADAKYGGEVASDTAGYALSGAGDVNDDGYADFLVGAYGNDDGGGEAGAAHLILGGSPPTSKSLTAADAQYTGEAPNDNAGLPVAGAGDIDGDGYDEVLVGSRPNSDGGASAGSAYLVRGSASPASISLSAADLQFTGESAGDFAGYWVTGVGDADADGFGDLLVGAYLDDDGGTDAGAVYLLLGGGL